MSQDQNDQGPGSWVESRRLIIAKLSELDISVKGLGEKLDRINDAAKERNTEMSRDTQTEIGILNIKVALIGQSLKIWGGAIGLVSGGIGAVVVQLVTKGIGK